MKFFKTPDSEGTNPLEISDLMKFLMQLAADQAKDRATMVGHIEECDRRYEDLNKKGDERHQENTERLERQDGVLRWLLITAVSILVSVITLLITLLVEGKHLGL